MLSCASRRSDQPPPAVMTDKPAGASVRLAWRGPQWGIPLVGTSWDRPLLWITAVLRCCGWRLTPSWLCLARQLKDIRPQFHRPMALTSDSQYNPSVSTLAGEPCSDSKAKAK